MKTTLRFSIPDQEHREAMVVALACSSYKVYVEDEYVNVENDEDDEDEEEDL